MALIFFSSLFPSFFVPSSSWSLILFFSGGILLAFYWERTECDANEAMNRDVLGPLIHLGRLN